MERRKFVIGVGSLAAGGAAATGTGAFTSAVVPRSADVTVQNDSNAYLQLEAGGARGVGDRIGQENGELYIDFDDEATGSGVNDNARYQIGAMNDDALGDGISFESLYDDDSTPAAAGDGEPYVESSDTDQSAFVVRNMSGQTLDLEIGMNTASANAGATVYLQGKATAISGDDGSTSTDGSSQLDGATATNTSELDLSDPTTGQDGAMEALSFNNANDPDEAIPPGASVYVSIQVDTRDGDTPDGRSLAEELTISANEAADPGEE
ncbi:hypothetical protein [Halorubrum aethiopicum]|uniref:hypothetical protein n=1 Tax=Halorubrum aethiopicum TaxID=1758255 RepID=UPI000AC030AE|nr:hypothetical protein [Halorubrum aethiopicum]